jgi:hypothetical protein
VLEFSEDGRHHCLSKLLDRFRVVGPLIKVYHGLLEEHEKQFSVDEIVVPIRRMAD